VIFASRVAAWPRRVKTHESAALAQRILRRS
jgi:hypothetical protein